jgi:hypothetical protein
MMAAYARKTTVSVERSQSQLSELLVKHGAISRVIGQDDEHHRALIGFSLGGARFRLALPLPKLPAPGAPRRDYDQACRTRWRLALLLIRAKLEAITLNLSTAPREFMADLVTDDGRTLEEVLASPGSMTRLLAASPQHYPQLQETKTP